MICILEIVFVSTLIVMYSDGDGIERVNEVR